MGGGHRSPRELRRKLPNYYAQLRSLCGEGETGLESGREERGQRAGVSCGWECGLGRTEEAEEEEELEVSQEKQELHR